MAMVSSRSLVLIAAMGVLAACSHGDEDEQKAEAPGVLDIVGVAVEGTWNRHAGSDRADDELLADIVALAEDPELAGDAADDAAIAAAESRLGVDLPPDFERVLRTPGAIGALEWYEPDRIERATSLGDELGGLLRVAGEGWRDRELLIEDLDGGSERIPAGDLAGYLVIGRSVLGDALLYDPSPNPKHACCVLVETPVIRNDTPTSYPGVHDWLVTEWALEKAID